MTIKFSQIVISLSIALSLCHTRFALADTVIKVGDDRETDLTSLCSKFPQNSLCKGFDLENPISLQERPGDAGNCSYISNKITQFSDCKVNFTDGKLAVYLEQGEGLESLNDARTTREVTITLADVALFNYLESEQNRVPLKTIIPLPTAIVGTAAINAITSNPQEISEIIVGFKNKSAIESGTLTYITIFLDRETGVALEEQLIAYKSNSGEQLAAIDSEKVQELRSQLLETRECIGCDLRGVDLREADLTEVVLTKANLEGANLAGANLAGAILRGSSLRGANLEKANLHDADLTTESFVRTNLQNTNLTYTDLSDSQLNGADLEKADLSNANLENTDLSFNQVTGEKYIYELDTILKDATLVNAQLSDSDLKETVLVNANLQNANLDDADLEDANFCGATMPDGSSSEQGCNE